MSSQLASQLVRPLSSTSAHNPLALRPKRSEGFSSYDHLKALEIQKHQEKVENRSKV